MNIHELLGRDERLGKLVRTWKKKDWNIGDSLVWKTEYGCIYGNENKACISLCVTLIPSREHLPLRGFSDTK